MRTKEELAKYVYESKQYTPNYYFRKENDLLIYSSAFNGIKKALKPGEEVIEIIHFDSSSFSGDINGRHFNSLSVSIVLPDGKYCGNNTILAFTNKRIIVIRKNLFLNFFTEFIAMILGKSYLINTFNYCEDMYPNTVYREVLNDQLLTEDAKTKKISKNTMVKILTKEGMLVIPNGCIEYVGKALYTELICVKAVYNALLMDDSYTEESKNMFKQIAEAADYSLSDFKGSIEADKEASDIENLAKNAARAGVKKDIVDDIAKMTKREEIEAKYPEVVARYKPLDWGKY